MGKGYEIRQISDFPPDAPDLYNAVGWSTYTARPDFLPQAFRGSLYVLGAFEGEALVGILRAVGDGVSILFIQDLLVRPDRQRQGIGTALFQALTARYPNIYQLELLTDINPATDAFYRSLGLQPAEDIGCRSYIKITY